MDMQTMIDATVAAGKPGDRLKNAGFAEGHEPVLLAESEPFKGDGVGRPGSVQGTMRRVGRGPARGPLDRTGREGRKPFPPPLDKTGQGCYT